MPVGASGPDTDRRAANCPPSDRILRVTLGTQGEAVRKGRIMIRAGRTIIAASLILGLAAPADAARHHRHHHVAHLVRHRAHKVDLRAHKADPGGYEFEVICEGSYVLTPDDEAGNRAAVEAAGDPAPAPTPLEEETPTEPE